MDFKTNKIDSANAEITATLAQSDIDANVEIWNFFQQYTIEGSTSINEESWTSQEIVIYPNQFLKLLEQLLIVLECVVLLVGHSKSNQYNNLNYLQNYLLYQLVLVDIFCLLMFCMKQNILIK